MTNNQNSQNWIREGQVVRAFYLNEYEVSGLVINSRVKYGGMIQHTLVLNHDLVTYGTVRPAGTNLLIDEDEVIK